MTSTRWTGPLRVSMTALALVLFVAGTHLCLVAGLARAFGATVPMSCMTSSAALRAPSSSAAGHACCGGASASSDAVPARPAPAPPESPCCQVLVLASAPAPDHGVASLPCPSAIAPDAAVVLAAPPVATLSVADAHDPPGSPPRAPSPARAPPTLR